MLHLARADPSYTAALLAMPYVNALGINLIAYTVLQSIIHAQEMRITVAVGTITLKSPTLPR